MFMSVLIISTLAQSLGIIIALEQGKYVPSIELAFRIAQAFGVALEEVFQYGEESK